MHLAFFFFFSFLHLTLAIIAEQFLFIYTHKQTPIHPTEIVLSLASTVIQDYYRLKSKDKFITVIVTFRDLGTRLS